MASLLLVHGPNFDLLGSRAPGVYGKTGLSDIRNTRLNMRVKMARQEGHEVASFQSISEHEIVNRFQQAAIRQLS